MRVTATLTSPGTQGGNVFASPLGRGIVKLRLIMVDDHVANYFDSDHSNGHFDDSVDELK